MPLKHAVSLPRLPRRAPPAEVGVLQQEFCSSCPAPLNEVERAGSCTPVGCRRKWPPCCWRLISRPRSTRSHPTSCATHSFLASSIATPMRRSEAGPPPSIRTGSLGLRTTTSSRAEAGPQRKIRAGYTPAQSGEFKKRAVERTSVACRKDAFGAKFRSDRASTSRAKSTRYIALHRPCTAERLRNDLSLECRPHRPCPFGITGSTSPLFAYRTCFLIRAA
eukprot:3040218-Pleurochrysis_carterae.AAC.1